MFINFFLAVVIFANFVHALEYDSNKVLDNLEDIMILCRQDHNAPTKKAVTYLATMPGNFVYSFLQKYVIPSYQKDPAIDQRLSSYLTTQDTRRLHAFAQSGMDFRREQVITTILNSNCSKTSKTEILIAIELKELNDLQGPLLYCNKLPLIKSSYFSLMPEHFKRYFIQNYLIGRFEKYQNCALYYLALLMETKQYHVLEQLFEAGVSAKMQHTYGVTLLHGAAESDSKSTQILLAHGADPLIDDGVNTPPVEKALFANDEITVRLLLERVSATLETQKLFNSFLHTAVTMNNFECVQMLLDKGADPLATDFDGITVSEKASAEVLPLINNAVASKLNSRELPRPIEV